jgi:excisionase family DNA binding protein
MAVGTKAVQRNDARVAAQVAARIRGADGRDVSVVVGDRPFPLAPELARLIAALLDDVSYGRDVISAPADLPIGTEVASDLLGVSRPWLTTMLDRGDIPSTRNGSKRRMRLGDVLDYRRTDDERRDRALMWEFLDED